MTSLISYVGNKVQYSKRRKFTNVPGSQSPVLRRHLNGTPWCWVARHTHSVHTDFTTRYPKSKKIVFFHHDGFDCCVWRAKAVRYKERSVLTRWATFCQFYTKRAHARNDHLSDDSARILFEKHTILGSVNVLSHDSADRFQYCMPDLAGSGIMFVHIRSTSCLSWKYRLVFWFKSLCQNSPCQELFLFHACSCETWSFRRYTLYVRNVDVAPECGNRSHCTEYTPSWSCSTWIVA